MKRWHVYGLFGFILATVALYVFVDSVELWQVGVSVVFFASIVLFYMAKQFSRGNDNWFLGIRAVAFVLAFACVIVVALI